jgi:hypothetical protein
VKWTVFVSFSGECCGRPHLWGQIVDARTAREAARKVFAEIRTDDREPHDYAVIKGPHLWGEVRDGQDDRL